MPKVIKSYEIRDDNISEGVENSTITYTQILNYEKATFFAIYLYERKGLYIYLSQSSLIPKQEGIQVQFSFGGNDEQDLHVPSIITNYTFSKQSPYVFFPNITLPLQFSISIISRNTLSYAGIYNLGLTCYIASSIQLLSFFPSFINLILSQGSGKGPITDGSQRLFTNLLTSLTPISIKEFINSFGPDYWNMVAYEQDAHEFMTSLFDKLDTENGKIFERERHSLFGVVSTRSIDCESLKIHEETDEINNDISIPVSGIHSISQALDIITSKEKISNWDSGSSGKAPAVRYTRYKSLPPILNFQLLRYRYNSFLHSPQKVRTHVDSPFHLDMAPYVTDNYAEFNSSFIKEEEIESSTENSNTSENQNSSSENSNTSENQKTNDPTANNSKVIKPMKNRSPETKYTLMAVIVHKGTASNGHYVTFAQPKLDGAWYQFNDSRVSSSTPRAVRLTFGNSGLISSCLSLVGLGYFTSYLMTYVRDDYIPQIISTEYILPIYTPLGSSNNNLSLINLDLNNHNNKNNNLHNSKLSWKVEWPTENPITKQKTTINDILNLSSEFLEQSKYTPETYNIYVNFPNAPPYPQLGPISPSTNASLFSIRGLVTTFIIKPNEKNTINSAKINEKDSTIEINNDNHDNNDNNDINTNKENERSQKKKKETKVSNIVDYDFDNNENITYEEL